MTEHDVIPPALLAAQRRYDAADAALTAAPRDVDPAELERLRAEEHLLQLLLRRAYVAAGSQWISDDGQRKVRQAARREG